nr:PREDICTED: protein FAM3D [Haliaeetus albicilla]
MGNFPEVKPCQRDAPVPDPCCCCSHLAPLLLLAVVIRYTVLLITLLSTWFIVQTFFDRSWKAISPRSWLGAINKPSSKQLPQHKCGNKSCPKDHFAFKITSGAANVVGPSICFDDMVLMSSMKNNIGRGLNIALVNGTSGQLLKTDSFDMYSGGKPTWHHTNTFLPSFRMNDKVRTQFMELGSSHVSKLGFRDNWVFLGAKGLNNKSPFEEHIKNDEKKNKYDGWPEMLEMEGCAPRKMD